MLTWVLIAGAIALAGAVAVHFAPAKISILVDTAGSTARAEMGLLWGLGPKFTVRALPRAANGARLAVFNDPARIGHALMTPGLADAAYEAVRRLYQLKPNVTRVSLGVNLAEPAQNLVVQTAVQAALAAAPAALRERVNVSKCDHPGAELAAAFELYAAPAELSSIWRDFKTARSVREFRRRLKRAPKPSKKAPREVRAA